MKDKRTNRRVASEQAIMVQELKSIKKTIVNEITNKSFFVKLVLVAIAYVSLNFLAQFSVDYALGQTNIQSYQYYFTTDIFVWGGSILLPFVMLGGVPVIFGIWTGHILCCLLSFEYYLTGDPITIIVGVFPLLISLPVIHLFTTKIRQVRWKFFIGCWIIILINIFFKLVLHFWLYSSQSSPYFRFWIFQWSIISGIIQTNIIGLVMLQVLRHGKAEFSRKSVVLFSGGLSLISTFLPWLSFPSASWFLWGITIGQIAIVPESVAFPFHLPLILILFGASLIILSSRLTKGFKQTLLAGAFFGAIGLITYMIFLLSLTIPLKIPHYLILSFLSYGFPIQLIALIISLTSIE